MKNTYRNGKQSLRARQPWRYAPKDSQEYADGYEAHYGRPWQGEEWEKENYQRHFDAVLPIFLEYGVRDHNDNLRLP